jgi:hypothetical protein
MEKAGRLGAVVKSVPLSATDMELRRQSLPAWFPDAYDALVARLCGPGPDYPCHFGVQGQQRGHNRFWAVDATALTGMGCGRSPAPSRRFSTLRPAVPAGSP